MLAKDPKVPAKEGRGQETAREIGRELREARQKRGEELAPIAAFLRIRPDYLAALEEGEFRRIPARTYLLGFLRSYGDYLGLDGNGLVARVRLPASSSAPLLPLRNYPELVAAPRRRPSGAALPLLLLTIGAWGVYHATTAVTWKGSDQLALAPSGTAPAPQEVAPVGSGTPTYQSALADAPGAMSPDRAGVATVGPGESERGTARSRPEPTHSEPLVPLAAPEPPAVSPVLHDPAATADVGPRLSGSPQTSAAVLDGNETGARQSDNGPKEIYAAPGPTSGGVLRNAGRGEVIPPGRPMIADEAAPPAGGVITGTPPATPASLAGRFAVQIALVRDAADAWGEWRRLAKLHPSLAGLGMQAPRAVEVVGKGSFYRVLGGAFAAKAEAQAACDELRSDGGDCRVVAF